jgi:hypothetical protein
MKESKVIVGIKPAAVGASGFKSTALSLTHWPLTTE